ncbi:hypothetical protein CYLTODRAFT_320211, partial [Cylindrobasidium torrendii FP15055 ss-10]
GRKLTDDDMDCVRAHNLKTDVDIGSRTYEKFKRAFPQISDLPSLKRLQTRIAFLSNLRPEKYDCCPNSCCLYVEEKENLDRCPYCQAPRYDEKGHPLNTFSYLPAIPRLIALYGDKETAEKLSYHANFEHDESEIKDVFDSTHYRHLCKVRASIGEEDLGYCHFSQPTDMAMGLSTDGVCPFCNRKQTC